MRRRLGIIFILGLLFALCSCVAEVRTDDRYGHDREHRHNRYYYYDYDYPHEYDFYYRFRAH